MGESPFLTIAEVAQLLRVSRGRAYQMAKEGAFPSIRLSPRRIRVPSLAFEMWLSEQTARAFENVHGPERAGAYLATYSAALDRMAAER